MQVERVCSCLCQRVAVVRLCVRVCKCVCGCRLKPVVRIVRALYGARGGLVGRGGAGQAKWP